MSVVIVRDYWRYPWLALLRIIIIFCAFLVAGLLLSNQNAAADPAFPTLLPQSSDNNGTMFLPAACFQAEAHLLDTLGSSFNKDPQKVKKAFFFSSPGNRIQGWTW